jgi:hypothetical protein
VRIAKSLFPLAFLASALGVSSSGALHAAGQQPAERVEFERDVRPILASACFGCHGPSDATRQANLRLDTTEFVGRLIVPGNAAASMLFRRITGDNVLRMPPPVANRSLSAAQIDTVRRWIEAGADLGGGGARMHWAFRAPVRPAIPVVASQAWPRNPIDAFVLARLEREKLKPSAEADRATLLRRVALDLTGLPPTPAEIDAFLADTSPNAYEAVVDRLLKSPRYGERMALEWLDAARYADTHGYQTDGERSMWRWRDWVIDAYNRNMPFDRFTIEQIAGDMLPNATLDQKIATGFNRNHSQNGEGGIVPEEFLVEYAVDRVETASTVFLGLTLGCARCHDHKYDPVSQKEFYEVLAHFNNVPERGKSFKYVNSPPLVTAPTADQQAQLAKLDEMRRAAREAFSRLESEIVAGQARWEASLASSARVDWTLRDRLVAHFPLDGDLAGIGAGASIGATLQAGLPQFVQGRVEGAASFDGQRFILVSGGPDFTYDQSVTMAAWIHPSAPDGVIVARANDGDQGEIGWGLSLAGGKVRVNLSTRDLDDGVRAETQEAIRLNEWQHVLATYDGSKEPAGFRIYVNGRLQPLKPLLDTVGNRLPQGLPLRIGSGGSPKSRFQGHIDDVRIYTAVLSPADAAMVAAAESVSDIARMPAQARTAAQAEKLRRCWLEQYAPPPIQQTWRQMLDLDRQRENLWNSFPTVMVMEEMTPRRETFRLIRGAYSDPGERVTPGVPAVLPPLAANEEKNRLAFARWLVDPKHPLTARVTVNRFWQMYFGTGLVKTAENFGTQGEPPSHPELLDWLATTFIESGWDVKAMQKTIVMSATYRQSSKVTPAQLEKDPENRLLARGPRLRLPAQVIRDQALALAGLLVERLGGPSVMPYQPAGLWNEVGERGLEYRQSKGDDLYRRSLYTFWKRTAGPPSMTMFGASTRETCIVRQTRTNTPLQALNLMNDVTYVEAARRLAERTMKEGGTTAQTRVSYAYRIATGSRPAPAAQKILVDSLARHQEHYRANRLAALDLVKVGERPRDESLDVAELASYTMVASMIMNLDATITKE